jgi:hypothetical protein
MTSSRSNILRNSLVVLAALVLWMGRADAGRKRVVVLDFEGPKAEKFHADVVKLIKKSHTVLTVDKWNEKADELDAAAITDKNIKKVAKKLKIDGVITGKIEKRRDEYIIRLKVRGGTTGETVGNPVQTKAESPRIDAQAQRDIKDELLPAIDELESNRSGGDDEEEEEDAPKKKKAVEEEEEEEEEPKKGGFSKKKMMDEEPAEDPKLTKKKKAEEEKRKKAEEEEAKRLAKEDEARKKKEDDKKKKDDEQRRKDEAKKADEAFAKSKSKKAAEEEAEEEEEEVDTKKRAKAKDDEEEEDDGKRTASADDEEGIEDSADVEERGSGRDLSPANRALDAVVGMSFTRRTLSFTHQSDLAKPPPGYKQRLPVAGAMLDMTFYPMSFSKSSKGIIRGIGLTVLYDQVLLINSKKRYSDEQGMQRIADIDTKESRWAVGPVLRYPLGKIVVGGSLTYGKQKFEIAQTLPSPAPANTLTDIPSVSYTMITPAAFLKYPVTSKITANADLAFHAITNTGQIQASGMTGYGAATVTGFEAEVGGDYMVTKNIFARVSLRYETISFKFKGDPTSQTNIRDTDPEQDVTGAKDTYMGGTATVGYVY